MRLIGGRTTNSNTRVSYLHRVAKSKEALYTYGSITDIEPIDPAHAMCN